MKKLLPKTAAIIGMIFTLICAFYLIKAAAYFYFPDLFDDGSVIYEAGEMSWGSSLFAILVSVFSLIFYGIDVVLSVLKDIKKNDVLFNIILVFIFVICLFLGIWVISSYLRNYKTIIWFISYFALFVFEIILTIRCLIKKN